MSTNTEDTKVGEDKKAETSSNEKDTPHPIDAMSEYIDEKAKFLASEPGVVAKSQIRRVVNEMALSLGRPRPMVFINDTSYDTRAIVGADLDEDELHIAYVKIGSDNVYTDEFKINSEYAGKIKRFLQDIMRDPETVSDLDWKEEWSLNTPDTSDD